MSDFLDVTFLSVLQGIAEFLPISSSGHLVIGQHLLGIKEGGIVLDTTLHFGTLLAIFVYYRSIIGRITVGALGCGGKAMACESWSFIGKIILSAIPAIIVYALAGDFIDRLFDDASTVGALLMFTGAVLLATRFLPRGERNVSWRRAIVMGVAQAIALLPGVSRSGMTLAAARMNRVSAKDSASFSFLMSAPIIMGGMLLALHDMFKAEGAGESVARMDPWVLLWGVALSGVCGYFSLKALEKVLNGRHFWLFGPYCIIAGLLTLCLCGQ